MAAIVAPTHIAVEACVCKAAGIPGIATRAVPVAEIDNPKVRMRLKNTGVSAVILLRNSFIMVACIF